MVKAQYVCENCGKAYERLEDAVRCQDQEPVYKYRYQIGDLLSHYEFNIDYMVVALKDIKHELVPILMSIDHRNNDICFTPADYPSKYSACTPEACRQYESVKEEAMKKLREVKDYLSWVK